MTLGANNSVDLYRFEYHFRYTSLKEQADIKQELQRAKMSQHVAKNCTNLYVFGQVQHTLRGLVNFRDAKDLTQVNLNPELIPLEMSNYEDDEKCCQSYSSVVTDHLLCHIYSSDRWSQIYTGLDQIIPEFIISKKPELVVTCTLKKVESFDTVGSDFIDMLRSMYSFMLQTVDKELMAPFSESSELLMIPEIRTIGYNPIESKLRGEAGLRQFLNFDTLKEIFGEHNSKATSSFLDFLEHLNSDHSKSLRDLSNTIRNGVNQIYEDPNMIDSVLEDQDFQDSLKQADHLNSLVRGLIVVSKHTNDPLVVESLDFLFNRPVEAIVDQIPIYLRLNYLEHSNHYCNKKWFRENGGPLAFKVRMIIDSVREKQSNERVELTTPEDDEFRRKQHWSKLRQQKDPVQEDVRARGVILPPDQFDIVSFNYPKMSKYFIQVQHPMELLCEQLAHYDKLARFEKEYHTPFLEMSKTTNTKAPLLLRTAFTHMSYAQEKQLRNHSYERLEFLGDALLHICVAIFMHQTFTTFETFNDDWYSLFIYLITNKHLYDQAVRMKLDQYILRSKAPNSSAPPKMVADLFESLLGSMYLVSTDVEYCQQFINTEYITRCLATCDLYQEKVQPRLETEDADVDRHLIEQLLVSHREMLDELEVSLGYHFHDRTLLLEALVHYTFNDSKLNVSLDQCSMEELKKMLKIRKNGYYLSQTSVDSTNGEAHELEFADFNRFNCEKLRFLGIALCKFLAAEYVYLKFPECDPRQLTLSIHCILDNSDVCIQHGINQLQLKKYILHKWPSVDCHVPLCESFFALLGAVFVDSGYDLNSLTSKKRKNETNHSKTPNLFSQLLLTVFDEHEQLHPDHVKSPIKIYVQYLCQIAYGSVPSYKFTESEEYDSKYECTIVCNGQTIANFKGSNRRAVEREACNLAVNTLLSKIEKSNDSTSDQ